MQKRKPATTSTITLRMIAERCQLSVAAVSQALRHDRRFVSEQTIARVQAMAHELGYNPSLGTSARRLRQSRSGILVRNELIALAFPLREVQRAYFASLLVGIEEEMSAAHYAMLTINSRHVSPAAADEHQLPGVVARGEVDGALIVNPSYGQMLAQRLRREPGFAHRPIVSLLAPCDGCSAVLADDYTGAYALMRHLLAQGHRYFLHFYEATGVHPHVMRLAAYQHACREQRLDPARHLIFQPLRLHTADVIFAECQRVVEFLQRHPEVTAVLAPHDYTARLLYDAFAQAGLRVPEDVSLCGFDDVEGIRTPNADNLLTTVQVPLEAMGRAAVHLLVQHIDHPDRSQETVTLPTTLVVRQSTAPPRVPR